jgi:hypothetical protein
VLMVARPRLPARPEVSHVDDVLRWLDDAPPHAPSPRGAERGV